MSLGRLKRCAAVHDISGFGKCSLTVALPILSAAGIETPVVPTAVLSTHTGGFSGYTYRDLTGDILPFVNHWRSLGLPFDGIYTGFLGSFEQIDIVIEMFSLLTEGNPLKIVDPVMADDGKLYGIFPANFPDGMRRLCAKADVIVPNVTEAALLLGEPYEGGKMTAEKASRQLKALSDLGPSKVVITGVTMEEGELGAACYEAGSESLSYVSAQIIEPMYHGTGDVFASVLTAGLLNGLTLEQSCAAAVEFTVDSIRRTKAAGTDNRFGVDFESGLGTLKSALMSNKQ